MCNIAPISNQQGLNNLGSRSCKYLFWLGVDQNYETQLRIKPNLLRFAGERSNDYGMKLAICRVRERL